MDTPTSSGDELANAIHQDMLDAQAAEDATAAERDALRKKAFVAIHVANPDMPLGQASREAQRLVEISE